MASAQSLLVIERILRDRSGVWEQIREDRDLSPLTGQLLASAAISLALYGAVLGASNGALQAVASAVKLPILLLVTLVICLPTLYLFNLVFGARLSIRQAVALVSVAVTVMSTLCLAFAPISLFFLVTAPHYSFYKLLNVAIMALTAFVGLKFLVGGMRSMNQPTSAPPVPVAPVPAAQPVAAMVGAEPDGQPAALPGAAAAGHPAPTNGTAPMRPAPPAPERQASMALLYVWIVVFGFVGTQLAWTLRPFVGSPGEPFAIFRHIEGNFYVDIVRTLFGL
ncbi:hypothetical protein Athai_34070 [Actinocatenispora thailandica]|uniref:Actin-binding WH2 domain-containing protein n=1 Tax=Actinocatenispora thailandica TaxID=227318 RepID=A0A7R7DQ82_9ACTN|nr:hypothetical protein [Actinocatenispora thailandica]BCJ35904.1 hypothetical protein Athai_34070 [Actinocatenispora thailandica]